MFDIEWHVVEGLRNRDHVLPESMGNSCFIHDVRVLSAEVDNHYMRAEDEVEYILNDGTFLPYVISPQTPATRLLAGGGYGIVYRSKFGAEWHHCSNEV